MTHIVEEERAKGHFGRPLGADEQTFAEAHVTAAGAAGAARL